MPTTQQDYETARQNAQQAQQEADSAKSYYTTFETKLRDKLREKATQRGADQISQMVARAKSNLVSAPITAMEKLSGSPGSAGIAAAAAARGQALNDLSIANDLRTQQQGSVSDIIGGINTGLAADAQSAIDRAAAARTLYGDVMNEYQLAEAQKQQQFQNDLALKQLALQQASLAKANEATDLEKKKAEAAGLLRNGATVEDVIKLYAGTLSLDDIIGINASIDPTALSPQEVDYYQKLYTFQAYPEADWVTNQAQNLMTTNQGVEGYTWNQALSDAQQQYNAFGAAMVGSNPNAIQPPVNPPPPTTESDITSAMQSYDPNSFWNLTNAFGKGIGAGFKDIGRMLGF